MSQRRIRKRSKVRRWFANLFMAAGVVGVGVWAGSYIVPVVSQDWDNWVFDRELRGQAASVSVYLTEKKRQVAEAVEAWWTPGFPPAEPPAAAPSIAPPARIENVPPRIANNVLVGRLTIPRLHLSAIVREGTGENTLSLALGHIPGTALPGQKGNVAVAGHRDTIFRALRDIRKNDVIRFETLSGDYVYRVGSMDIVKPEDVGVLRPSGEPELTLVTCYPFYYVGSAPDRFIAKARQVSSEDLTAEGEATLAESAAPPESEAPPVARKGGFSVGKNHSGQLAPGISLGVTDTDTARRRVNGWLWLMPDRRTIWLRNHDAHEPLIFYRAGKRRELRITVVSESGVTGYLR
jgi:sortase A